MSKHDGSAPALWAFAEGQHHELIRGINRIHDVGCEFGHRPTPDLAIEILAVLDWLRGVLEPHMAWEEASLYPEIDRRAGSTWATCAPRLEHHRLRELTARLQADRTLLAAGSQRDRHCAALSDLFGLEALLRAHIEVEEGSLFPVLIEGRMPEAIDDGLRPVEAGVR
jgi:iron-sulfur cluster repair protein YtfE (RIC family)